MRNPRGDSHARALPVIAVLVSMAGCGGAGTEKPAPKRVAVQNQPGQDDGPRHGL
jgi:predicted small lipoprotein YifL